MSSHDHHESLHGYEAGQLLIDGCGECETRAHDLNRAMQHMDPLRFREAWLRATAWGRADQTVLSSTSRIERPLLSFLWAIQLKLEQLGITESTALVAAWWTPEAAHG